MALELGKERDCILLLQGGGRGREEETEESQGRERGGNKENRRQGGRWASIVPRGLPTAVLVFKLQVLCPGKPPGSWVILEGGDPEEDSRRRKESNQKPFSTGQMMGREEMTVPWAWGEPGSFSSVPRGGIPAETQVRPASAAGRDPERPLGPKGLTFHGEHPSAKVLEVDSPEVVGIQIFDKFFHL